MSKSKGEIICLLDGDDLFKKTKLREINKFFQSNKATNFVQDKINFTKNIIKENRTFLFFNILPNFFPTSTFSIKKNSLDFFLKKYSSNKFNLLEIDARLFFFFKDL